MAQRKKLTQKRGFKAGADPQFMKSLKMGPWTSYSLLHDPRHMCFVLSRYKFCAKMFEGKNNVLEVGCGDGFGIAVVAQVVNRVLGIDSEERLIKGNRERLKMIKKIEFRSLNICQEVPDEMFDATFSIDVIEHLDPQLNKPFMENQCACLKEDGICIVGTPNLTAFKYAKDLNKVQHINSKSHKSLRKQMERYFKNVFIFSMNDEVVHTGFGPMAHYLFAMGVGIKRRPSI